ncbi:MAG: radical SAM protein [Planctomycetota bacterium]|nr:MAG: radical SAM protein [Planctomycetota bacterium]
MLFTGGYRMSQTSSIRIADRVHATTVLGPGTRAGLWVQGCDLACPGCIAPHTHKAHGGSAESIEAIVEWLEGLRGIDGLTISGGEPFQQMNGVLSLVTRLRHRGDWSIMLYSGYTMEALRRRGEEAMTLIKQLDIFIDGPYQAHRATAMRWRGSDNQRIHFITERHQEWASQLEEEGLWMEARIDDDGTLRWTGVPPPGFIDAMHEHMAHEGLRLRPIAGP